MIPWKQLKLLVCILTSTWELLDPGHPIQPSELLGNFHLNPVTLQSGVKPSVRAAQSAKAPWCGTAASQATLPSGPGILNCWPSSSELGAREDDKCALDSQC